MGETFQTSKTDVFISFRNARTTIITIKRAKSSPTPFKIFRGFPASAALNCTSIARWDIFIICIPGLIIVYSLFTTHHYTDAVVYFSFSLLSV